jgi:hypothetical protein
MNKITLDTDALTVESFDTVPNLAILTREGRGTACFETCKTDPTSDPDVETCGG